MRWSQAPVPREQLVLFSTTLDDRIPADHTVRLLAEILDIHDWAEWERHYVLVEGQPPIHPKIVAGALLYGLTLGIRSSRRLEYMCGHSIDFMWLTGGRVIDHSTFCGFRTRFQRELKDLFRQINLIAMRMGLIRLNQVGYDGTRVKANSSRQHTVSAKTLDERLVALDAQIEEMFAQIDENDQEDLFGDRCSSTSLPRSLADMQRRQESLHKALKAAQAMDARRQKRSDGPKKAAKVPVADPDSAIMPNKEGGHAPNYNPLAAADGHRGFIVDADVVSGTPESETVIPTIERIDANLGTKPEQFLADTAFATGQNLTDLQRCGVEAFMPVEQARLQEDNPALRPDPTQPVGKKDWPKLPRNPQSKKLDRAGFVYEASKDCYYCPMGRRMNRSGTTRDHRRRADSIYQLYRCADCNGCPLATECLGKKARTRTVSRDQHEPLREAQAARMGSERGREIYGRRAWIAETPFAFTKTWMGLRQFLLRGLAKVRTEWLWTCTAFNLRKLIREIARLRARFSVATG